MEWLRETTERRGRLVSLPWYFPEREAYLVRRDRGTIPVEHRVTSWFRPTQLTVMNSGIVNLVFPLGCWRYPRPMRLPLRNTPQVGGPTTTRASRSRVNTRAPNDSATLAKARRGNVHAAALLVRADLLGERLRSGANVEGIDSLGMTPLVRVASAQNPSAGYDPAREEGQLNAVDTLLSHGAVARRLVEAGAAPGRARAQLQSRLDDPGPGGFWFYNRGVAKQILRLLP